MSDEDASATPWTVREDVSDTESGRRRAKPRDGVQAVSVPGGISAHLSATAVDTEWLPTVVTELAVATPGGE